jgi:hypothetical protein
MVDALWRARGAAGTPPPPRLTAHTHTHTHTPPAHICLHCSAARRRAKRLRRILRQFDSPIARGPLLRFWRGTWAAVAALALVQIVCFAVLSYEIVDRYA